MPKREGTAEESDASTALTSGTGDVSNQSYVDWHVWFYGFPPVGPLEAPVIPPPPDLQPVVDKTAEFVARFGPQAEDHLRQRTELQLDFLRKDHPYFPYYQMKVRWIQYNDKLQQESAEQTESSVRLEVNRR